MFLFEMHEWYSVSIHSLMYCVRPVLGARCLVLWIRFYEGGKIDLFFALWIMNEKREIVKT